MTEPARILIVEDDAAIRTMVYAVLKRQGFDAQTVKDGQEAIDALELQSFDLILLDLMMPKVDGFGVIEFLERIVPEKVPNCIVVLTAASNAHLKPLDEKRVRKVLRKPFELDELLATVRECLNNGPEP